MSDEYNHRKPVERFIALLEKVPLDKWERDRSDDGSIRLRFAIGELLSDTRTVAVITRGAHEHTLYAYRSWYTKHGSGMRMKSSRSSQETEFTGIPEDLQNRLSTIVDAHERFLREKKRRLDVLQDAATDIRKQLRDWSES